MRHSHSCRPVPSSSEGLPAVLVAVPTSNESARAGGDPILVVSQLPIHLTSVKSIPPSTENWLRKRYKYSKKNDKSTEDKHETNHINNKYNDMNMNTRKMHNI